MEKKYCGKCPELDLSRPLYRYGKPYYRCKRFKKNKGTEKEPKWEYKVRKAHDVCLEIEVPVTIKEEEIKFKVIETKGKSIEEVAKIMEETIEEFVPPDPVKEIVEEGISDEEDVKGFTKEIIEEPIPLSPEEEIILKDTKKLERIAELKRLIKEAEE